MSDMSCCSCPQGGPIEVKVGPWAVPPLDIKGDKNQARVSASGGICKGEFVRAVVEYVLQGDVLRWALEDVTVLTCAELSQGRVGVVFTQGGQTKFKTLAVADGNLVLGNTLVLAEDEAADTACLLEMSPSQAIALYNHDTGGEAAIISLAGRTATLAYTDTWDDHDPQNICACCMDAGRVAVCGMRPTTGEAWVRTITPGESDLLIGDAIRVDGNNDTDIYAGAWSMAQATGTAAVLTYHQALDKPVQFAVLDMNSSGGLAVRCFREGKYAASLPTLQTVSIGHGSWIVAYGIGWLSADRQVVKSTLALEAWSLSRYAADLLWYACEDIRYSESIGGVSIQSSGVGVAASYAAEGEARAIYLGLAGGLCPGPAVPMGAYGAFCQVVPISTGKALVISGRDGNGYVQLAEAVPTVIPSDTLASGLALSGGGPGEKITVLSCT